MTWAEILKEAGESEMTTEFPPWALKAEDEIGVKEIVGKKHNPRVVDYFKRAGHPEVKDDETAWCAVFACAMLEDAGYRSPKSAWARDFLKWGEKIDIPVPGCIVVFRRGDGGHVGFYVEHNEDRSKIKVLGGNQSNAVNYSYYNAHDLLGYRVPTEILLPKPVAPPVPVLPPVEITTSLVEAELREKGSRTIKHADATEVQAKMLAGGGVVAFLSSVMTVVGDLHTMLSPLAPLLGVLAISGLSLGFAVYITHNAKAVKSARVDDHMTGANTGRKDD